MPDEKPPQTNDSPQDSVVATKVTVEGEPTRQTYIVTSKAGLFKNGTDYKKGSEIELDDQTASNFMALGEVELKEIA